MLKDPGEALKDALATKDEDEETFTGRSWEFAIQK